MTAVEYCPLCVSAEFDTQPLPPIADGKDLKALLARVTRGQIKCAALQIHSRSCCDAAFPRGSMTAVEYCPLCVSAEFDTQPLPRIADGKDLKAPLARVTRGQIKCAALQIDSRGCCHTAFLRDSVITVEYCHLCVSAEFDTHPLPPIADGKDLKALLARVKCAQTKRAALQIHSRGCCDMAFPRDIANTVEHCPLCVSADNDTQPLPLLP